MTTKNTTTRFVWSNTKNDEAFLKYMKEGVALWNAPLTYLSLCYDPTPPIKGFGDSTAPWLKYVDALVETNKDTLTLVDLNIPYHAHPVEGTDKIVYDFPVFGREAREHLQRLIHTTLKDERITVNICGLPLSHFGITAI